MEKIKKESDKPKKTFKTEEEWKKKLSKDAYHFLRQGGTEPPFSGKYVDTKDKGTYKCAACGNPLFNSKTKFDSTKGAPGLEGWPSFEEAIPGSVKFLPDHSFGMQRTEVICAKCGSHLGHTFEDDASSTKKHYCINSVCLNLEKEDLKKESH
ncbi:MAG: peptide-methionine (R)-S-oxide reductase [Candidatus Magasanikbacteria bacterium RIFCSPHIGHO2_01_FULL_33_34]|uniref:peptide-methionine (R)-S-oxide reductase n=1 Tax=Candidatus Magasanikbacteria bacterium RIFCSPHIGHO2_01_FULL_33_34 TaxID=1798671 RepID=A0A1F6LKS2_9BACT|nr:MAG: peptide-methionine (R)-S-oxide reductase [Candidatus Magasanikbacteria bacterium RIFCSPHIGHO2_01_FULL_33_34]